MALVAGMMSAAPASAIPRLHPNPAKAHSLFTKLADESRASAKSYKAGQYIVRLKASPVSTYAGGVHGFVATKPAPGKQLDAKATAVKQYSAHLRTSQNTITSHYGVKPMYNYTLAFNGFSANLSAKQANELAKNSSVSTLVRSQKLKVQADPIDAPPVNSLSSIRYLNVDTGVWDKNGGPANAGKGVVLGDIDTGIAPENPSFAGSPLGTAVKASTTPAIIDGGGVDTVQFKKADGNVFSSSIIPDDAADGWTRADLSTKIIAAHYFVKGFGTANLGSTAARGEYISPRDGAGHGSHTASTAAGDYSVSENVSGTDFGKISGVAPAAKIAVYKVCWDGPALDESQDGCDTSDMVAAIDQAVQDGVDVLNFSIGGSSGAATTFSPTDEAFYNAASAGIFVAAAGGNAGPDASTLDNASPWETTVAASTIPSYTATATFGNGTAIQGASNDVGYGTLPQVPANSPLVDATTSGVSGDAGADAALCAPDSLDSTKVTGKVVLCDRGTYDRVAKSAEVKRAGGIGMVLLNTPGGAADTDLDLHTVPSIHINASNSTTLSVVTAAYNALHTYAKSAGATVSFAKSADTSPVPQIAGFSSHGPVLADGSDIMKPDVSAPGVSILAAVANGPAGSATAAPKWDFYSGTSMATPHVAGLALLYLAVHPLASVSEIQSALMTTATNTVDSEGKAVTDPFAQGAGEVKPSAYLNPGLLFLSKQSDWNNYLYSVGEVTHADAGFSSAVKIDPSNLNRASIAIGDFFGTQKVTRTVTAQSTGTYTPSVGVKGVKASVSPSSVKFTKLGQTRTFTITFTRTTAPLDEWTSGFMTFKKSGSTTTVRLPIAIHPTSIQAPAEVDGVGVTGSAPVPLTAGAKLTVGVIPYIAGSTVETPKTASDGSTYSDTAMQGGHAVYQDVVTGAGPCTVEAGCANSGSEFLRWNAKPVPARGADTDLDLYVAYYASASDIPAVPTIDNITPNLVGESATSANDETVSYFPTEDQYENGGVYVAYVDYFATPDDGANFAESFTNLTDDSIDPTKLDTSPDYFSMATGQKKTLTAKWAGLESNSDYSGILFFVDPSTFDTYNATFMDINTDVPVVKTKPTITGTAKVGQTLTAHTGTFDSSNGTRSYQWLSGGAPIAGATDATHVVTTADVGHALSVVETYSVDGGTAVTATSAATAVVKLDTTTAFTIVDATITTHQQAELDVTVALTNGETLPAGATITGTLTVKSGTTTLKFATAPTVHGGVAEFLLQKFIKGTKSITVTFNGSGILNTSKSAAHSIKVS